MTLDFSIKNIIERKIAEIEKEYRDLPPKGIPPFKLELPVKKWVTGQCYSNPFILY